MLSLLGIRFSSILVRSDPICCLLTVPRFRETANLFQGFFSFLRRPQTVFCLASRSLGDWEVPGLGYRCCCWQRGSSFEWVQALLDFLNNFKNVKHHFSSSWFNGSTWYNGSKNQIATVNCLYSTWCNIRYTTLQFVAVVSFLARQLKWSDPREVNVTERVRWT